MKAPLNSCVTLHQGGLLYQERIAAVDSLDGRRSHAPGKLAIRCFQRKNRWIG